MLLLNLHSISLTMQNSIYLQACCLELIAPRDFLGVFIKKFQQPLLFYSQMNIQILVLLVLLALTIAESVTRTVDFFGTVCQERAVQMQRVQREVNVTYTYALQTNGGWQQFPDMKINFYLARPQFVLITYNINLKLLGVNFFSTRVLIDKVENTYFRYTTDYAYHHTHFVSKQVWMDAGNHEVMVQYTQNGGFYNNVYDQNKAALFLVEYFQF